MMNPLQKLFFPLWAAVLCLSPAGVEAQRTVSLYPYTMDVTSHPDYRRHAVRAPGDSTFGHKVHFISLRDLTGRDVGERIDLWVNRLKLGDVLWPAYPMIYDKGLRETVAEIKRRKLYLFDLYGYIPGSGPGGYWQQYTIPEGVLGLFQQQLGDHWLGMDNGEQDGRYIGSFAPRLYPMGTDRKGQYLAFQRFFEEMGRQLGNRMATLVSLNYGHYFLKEGVYTLIGAETAQGLPNAQVYYSYIRGAGKQYGVHWFGNASIYNRWGWKSYEPGQQDPTAGPTKGTSLSLLKRLMYTQMFYNCSALGFESSMTIGRDRLSPIGRIQQAAAKWNDRYGQQGAMYAPVALLHDFYAGWTFPRHLYSGEVYRVWGNLPYAPADYLTDNLLQMVYPGYQDASYYRDERGFIAPTPYGDLADCLLSDAPLWLLRQYPVVIVADELGRSMETRCKLEAYVKAGGHLVITAGSLRQMPGGLAGVEALERQDTVTQGAVTCGERRIEEGQRFVLVRLSYPRQAEVLCRQGDKAAAVRMAYGEGQLTVLASPYGVGLDPSVPLPVSSAEEKPLARPYPVLRHVEAVVGDVMAGVKLFDLDPDLSWTVDVKGRGDYRLVVTNSQWTPRPLAIRSRIGPISSIREMKTDESEVKATGYTPETVKGALEGPAATTISGGGVRAFRILIDHPQVKIMPPISPVANDTGRALTLRNIRSIKEEVLLRPTFFQHYDRVVVDWRYVEDHDKASLESGAAWTGLQRLGISVDLTSGLNLYPDLRIVANDSIYYPRSMERMRRIIDKMHLMGADELIVTSQRTIENNFPMDQFYPSLVRSLRQLADYAAPYGIRLLFRPCAGRPPESLKDMTDIARQVGRQNFYLAPSLSLLLSGSRRPAATNQLRLDLELLAAMKVSYLFVSAPERDCNGQLSNANLPICRSKQTDEMRRIIQALPNVHYLMDGLYDTQDDEYLDGRLLDELRGR